MAFSATSFISPQKKDRSPVVDFDLEKITVANHGYSRGEQLHFDCADITSYDIKNSIRSSSMMSFIISNRISRTGLLMKCFEGLNPGGLLLIRDGDRGLEAKAKGTELTEFFSVQLFRFNKAKTAVAFYFRPAAAEPGPITRTRNKDMG